MSWEKLGNIFTPDSVPNWPYTFGAVPFLERIEGDIISILFTSRNEKNQSLLTRAHFDGANGFTLIDCQSQPLMEIGKAGTFDDAGTMGCQVFERDGSRYLYYQGWNVGGSVPFRNAIGLARYNADKDRYLKISEGPILDRSIHDVCFVATPEVFQLSSDQFIMYYLSCDSWTNEEGDQQHKYNLKIAHSRDGLNWTRRGEVAIDYASEHEYAVSVPRVIKDGDIFKMWYSFRGSPANKTYRIGYAESNDAIHWKRMDDSVGIDVSSEGWDAEMISYPYVFDFKGSRYMLYNGNGYGKTGFGIAKWKER